MLIPSSSSSNVKDSDLLGLRAGNMLTVQLQDYRSSSAVICLDSD